MGVWCRCDAFVESEIFKRQKTYLSTGECFSVVLVSGFLIYKSVFFLSHTSLTPWAFRSEER